MSYIGAFREVLLVIRAANHSSYPKVGENPSGRMCCSRASRVESLVPMTSVETMEKTC